jgi:hypothetical protein
VVSQTSSSQVLTTPAANMGRDDISLGARIFGIINVLNYVKLFQLFTLMLSEPEALPLVF